jgi:diaminopimelate decarboxylase
MTLRDLLPTLRPTLAARLEPRLWPRSAQMDCDGALRVGGVDLADMAEAYGTPAVAIDVDDIRSRIAAYRDAMPDVEIAYAAKAFLTRAMARLVDEEGLSLDVCSGGEVGVAAAAGFPGERMILHGNVKTPADIAAALQAGVGRIVIDSLDEITMLATMASGLSGRQQVLVRVAPGVDAHTHAGLTTGTEDQKFGLSIATGAAAEAVRRVLAQPELELVGLHCHIGSQVATIRPYLDAATRVLDLHAAIAREHGIELPQLDIGGGHAVAYAEGDRPLDPAEFGRVVPAFVERACAERGVSMPRLTIEPGRALVARAGVTVYRVAAVKRGATRTFVAVDGGMSDNPRPALYGVRYPVRLIGRPVRDAMVAMTVVGRHCESSDVLAEDVLLPAGIAVGDLVAVPCSGAYHVSLSSTYNQVGRPPVVAVENGRTTPMLRRETLDDLLRRDVLPADGRAVLDTAA